MALFVGGGWVSAACYGVILFILADTTPSNDTFNPSQAATAFGDCLMLLRELNGSEKAFTGVPAFGNHTLRMELPFPAAGPATTGQR